MPFYGVSCFKKSERGMDIMNQVLILTRNILAEQEIQQKLQALNYEVYCSVSVFDYCNQSQEMIDFFKFFQYVILSESICESEVNSLIPLLRGYSLNIIRKVETKMTKRDQKYLEAEKLDAIISINDSVDELRECLYTMKNRTGSMDEHYINDNVVPLSGKVSLVSANYLQKAGGANERKQQISAVLHRLSPTELKILSILTEAGDHVITREVICHKIWEEEATKSHLASLSSTVTRIKSKFEQVNLDNTAIHTLWGKGYLINQQLLDYLKSESFFNRVVSNG